MKEASSSCKDVTDESLWNVHAGVKTKQRFVKGYLLLAQVLLLQGSQHLLGQQLPHLTHADVKGQFGYLKDPDPTTDAQRVNVLNLLLKSAPKTSRVKMPTHASGSILIFTFSPSNI